MFDFYQTSGNESFGANKPNELPIDIETCRCRLYHLDRMDVFQGVRDELQRQNELLARMESVDDNYLKLFNCYEAIQAGGVSKLLYRLTMDDLVTDDPVKTDKTDYTAAGSVNTEDGINEQDLPDIGDPNSEMSQAALEGFREQIARYLDWAKAKLEKLKTSIGQLVARLAKKLDLISAGYARFGKELQGKQFDTVKFAKTERRVLTYQEYTTGAKTVFQALDLVKVCVSKIQKAWQSNDLAIPVDKDYEKLMKLLGARLSHNSDGSIKPKAFQRFDKSASAKMQTMQSAGWQPNKVMSDPWVKRLVDTSLLKQYGELRLVIDRGVVVLAKVLFTDRSKLSIDYVRTLNTQHTYLVSLVRCLESIVLRADKLYSTWTTVASSAVSSIKS